MHIFFLLTLKWAFNILENELIVIFYITHILQMNTPLFLLITNITPVLKQNDSIITSMLHPYYTPVTLLLTHILHWYYTLIAPMLHNYYIRITPVLYPCYTVN